jgi:hypothetical protein
MWSSSKPVPLNPPPGPPGPPSGGPSDPGGGGGGNGSGSGLTFNPNSDKGDKVNVEGMSPEELVCHLIDQATKPHYIEYLVGTRRTDPGRDKRIVRTVRD